MYPVGTTMDTTPTPTTNVQDSYQHQDADRPNPHHVGPQGLHELEDLRRANSSTYARLMSAMRDNTERRMVAALCNHEGLTYDELDAHTSISRRRTRERVYDLRDDGVVTTTDSYTVFVEFTDEDTRVLAEDALSMFF